MNTRNKTAEQAAVAREFDAGRLSRRDFMRKSAALGVTAAAPLAFGARHAKAQAADRYDYIVIGAGSAGCALAARLSEDADKNVLVLEAGPADENQYIHIPAAFPNLFQTPLDWAYTSTPQEHSDGLQLYMPRGKVFGGCSSINAMIYKRGNPVCYDAWGADNPGWSHADVLPLFKRSENNERGADDSHGVGGPLNVADLRDPNPVSLAMVEAAVEAGYPTQSDFNAGTDQEGFGLYQVTQKDGMRNSTAVAFLHPALERDNLAIQAEAHAQNLIIEDGRCTGVRFKAGEEMHEVFADAEVILSAGSIGSPQILMLSGIGPRAHLEEMGISVLHDLPGVGQNLQEHLMAPVAHVCTQPVTLAHALEPEQAELLGQGMGLLTSNIGEGGGYLTVMEDAPAPDLQFHFAPTWFISDGAGNPTDSEGFTILPSLVGTKSVGEITLASANPDDAPLINPNAFAEPQDLEILVEGVKIARKIMASPALDDFRGEERFPGPAVQTDEEIRNYLRGNSQTIYHPVGTCKMGSGDMAVVGADLKVHGIEGLRVADASIMPTIVNGNTNAAAIMIGEKCSDLIRA
ncbi:GMC family oxidoreductase [Sulfitobacter delicatus]|uniref:Choline dehydrogenase n=1 Tax=Sulfitobacter delicatus TaxID=218672 RepID=A0A1G7ZA56_9RHOB|nr:GMC family oxidoreductase N-terminal domain-containing protein [Sulfitobacter delicatus]SDH05489.1 choline dehydrogenase [Sulfitobacter delicatus]